MLRLPLSTWLGTADPRGASRQLVPVIHTQIRRLRPGISLKFFQPLSPCPSVCTLNPLLLITAGRELLAVCGTIALLFTIGNSGSSRENADMRKVRGILSSGERYLGSQTKVNRNSWPPARGSQRNVLPKVRCWKCLFEQDAG